MTGGGRIAGGSVALRTDLYELTMAHAYWKIGWAERPAVFHAFYRRAPFGGTYALACGLDDLVEDLLGLAFDEDELAYLAAQRGSDGRPLFEEGFLETLRGWRFACDVDAVPEGRLVFPHEPMVRVRGPLAQAQLLETLVLNRVNFQTLVATKASRVVRAAAGASVLEFGLRRAQGPDGGLSAARAALVGGCTATSNVLAGRLYDVPVSGTHAHSWVMAHESEEEAFEAWARAMPGSAIFLVDTYDSVEGVRRAIRAARGLRAQGQRMLGVRLDSGDLGALAFEARRLLDEAGFREAKVIASGELDEHRIAELVARGAPIDVYGVGTKLTTASDDPALGGVYKITAIADEGGAWHDRIKLSEEAAKTSIPGVQQVRRYFREGRMLGDLVWDEHRGIGDATVGYGIADPQARVDVSAADAAEDVLVPVFREGKLVAERPGVAEIAERARGELARLPEAWKGLGGGAAAGGASEAASAADAGGATEAASASGATEAARAADGGGAIDPERGAGAAGASGAERAAYPVGLEAALHARREELIERLRREMGAPGRRT